MNQDTNKKSSLSFTHIFLGSLISSILIIAFGIFLFSQTNDINFWSKDALKAIHGNNLCYFDEKWDSGTYLQTITSFYTTIITLLIAMQAIISWISFVIVKNSSKEAIDNSVEKELPRIMEQTSTERKLQELMTNINEQTEQDLLIQLELIRRDLEVIVELNQLETSSDDVIQS